MIGRTGKCSSCKARMQISINATDENSNVVATSPPTPETGSTDFEKSFWCCCWGVFGIVFFMIGGAMVSVVYVTEQTQGTAFYMPHMLLFYALKGGFIGTMAAAILGVTVIWILKKFFPRRSKNAPGNKSASAVRFLCRFLLAWALTNNTP